MTVYKFSSPPPYAHQKKGVKFLLRNEWGGALLMEPRTGKTRTTIDWLSILNFQGKIDQAVIVCPNRVLGTWLNEIHTFCTRRVHITVWDAKERKKGVPSKPPGYDLYVILVNFDAFGTPGKRTASGRRSKASGRFKVRTDLRKWMAGAKGVAGVIDESHKIKSPSGKVSNMIVSMRQDFAYRTILTGTPQTKAQRAHDIYMQWQFLNPDRFKEYPTAADFKMHFGKWLSRNGFEQYIGPKNIEELRSKMAQDAYIVRRDQCFDLPPREDRVVKVALTAHTRRAYDQMAEEMIARISECKTAEASIRLVQTLRLSQITSGFVTLDTGEIERLGYEKADALMEILDDEFEKEQKVVIAARWRPDLDLIEHLVRKSKVPVWSIRGGVTREESDQAILDFRNHDGAGAIVIQPSASSLGIDLSTSAHMIWYSHTPSWVDFTQACDRIALSRNSTTFTHLVAESSVDEVLMQTLATDGDVAREIMTHPEELLTGTLLDLDSSGRISVVTKTHDKKEK